MAGYRVVLTPAADRHLAKLPHQAREMVAAALVTLARNPRPAGCVKLSGADDLWRIRVRQYRVIYQIVDAELIVTIVKVGAARMCTAEVHRQLEYDRTQTRRA